MFDKPTSQPSILLVDDDPTVIRVLARILCGVAHLRFATNGEEALQRARESTPDLVLLDAQMPGASGFEVCQAFKADEVLAEVPVIFVTSHSGPAFEVSGFDSGAADFIAKPVHAELVLARVKAQLKFKRVADELRRLSTTDALTGLANRRRFDESLAREWRRAWRDSDPIALLMIDVDHFKHFNDRHGHPAGDACLRTVAHTLADTLQRPADLAARWGGEEFAVLLPQTSRAGAERIAHLMLDGVEALSIAHAASPTAEHVTVSIGISCYDKKSPLWIEGSRCSHVGHTLPAALSSPHELVQAADRALYAAKRGGRAQGRLLDMAGADTPAAARELSARYRSANHCHA